MSATNRGAVRSEHDFYRTPAWCVDALFSAWRPLSRELFCLEPCAGDGCLAEAAAKTLDRAPGGHTHWDTFDIVPRLPGSREHAYLSGCVVERDFLSVEPSESYDLIITNPPYSKAREIIEHALKFEGADVVMLLRLNFLASAKRAPWLQGNMPDVYVLPNRPDFTGGGGDSIDYAWFVWPWPRNTGPGKLVILPTTPKSERT